MKLPAALVAAALVIAACGGSDSAASTTPPTTASTTTTVAPTTIAAPTSPPTTASTTTETTIDPALIAPLTGIVGAEGVDLDRPALVLKIDNHPTARPQTGLDQADIVFDLRAESVTRFTAVFHSQTPDPAGPVRSSRTSDFDLLWGLDNPLYGSSGGNDYVMSEVRNIETIPVTNQSRREYFRNADRPAPHNLYVDATDLWALAPSSAGPPGPWFAYRTNDDTLPVSATRAPDGEITIAFRGGPTVGFTWDPGREGWLRTQSGQPHTMADGTQLAPPNVVVMVTTYRVSPADPVSPELVSTGSGDLFVLTAGHVIAGTWERADKTDKPTLLDATGEPIALTPGQTWVLYPESGQVTIPATG